MKKVALIHTGFVMVEVLTKLFKQIIPEAELMHIVDDSLLREVLANGKVTKPVINRMLNYFRAAEYYNAECVFNVCSSVGEVADLARGIISKPIVKIDEKMAEEAVAKSSNIGVVATLKSTLDPTIRMIQRKAREIGTEVKITKTICPGAFEQLMNGNPARHDDIVLNGTIKIANRVDIIVFAQASMARLVSSLDRSLTHRVLSSPESGVRETRRVLGL